MRIIFIPQECFPFHGNTIEERPLGGIETGVIRLSEALQALGHEVYCATPFKENPPTPVKYFPYSQIDSLEWSDVYIAVRGWRSLFTTSLKTKANFFWTGDMWNVLSTVGIGDQRVIQRTNGLFGVSTTQLNQLCHYSGYPIGRTWALRNGVYLPYFKGDEVRNPYRLIYSSTPDRGLKYLPAIFKILKKKYPELELHIFSSLDRYSLTWKSEYDPHQDLLNRWDDPNLSNPEIQELMNELAHLPGCVLHGSVIQRQLAREFMKSAILVYPSSFNESSCITAMEAQVAGCPVIATEMGALKETLGEAGILIPETPGTEAYTNQFVGAVDQLLSNPTLYQHYSSKGKEKTQELSWNHSAKRLLNYLKLFYSLE